MLPLGGGIPVGAESSSFWRSGLWDFAVSSAEFRGFCLASLAFRAASRLSWRIVLVKEVVGSGVEGWESGVGVMWVVRFEEVGSGGLVGVFIGVDSCIDVGGGLEGVFVADAVGVDTDAVEEPRLSLTSPYSFHSSTCSRSWDGVSACFPLK